MEAGKPHNIRPIAPCEARRIEAGIFNYGSDMTIADTPFHVMGLERLVETQDADYIGKAALEEIRAKGVDRKLVGIEVAGDALPFELSRKCDALSDGKAVGTVTDLIWSPRLEKNIGYVWVPIDLAGPGNALEIVAPGRRHLAGPDGRDPVPRPEEDRAARMSPLPARRPPVTTRSPLTPDEIAAVRKPYRAASLLPGRAYHDPAIHEFERDRVVPARLDRGRPRVGRRRRPGRTAWRPSTTSRSSWSAAATRSCAASTTSASIAARPSSRSRAGRRSASSARTTPGSTTWTAR